MGKKKSTTEPLMRKTWEEGAHSSIFIPTGLQKKQGKEVADRREQKNVQGSQQSNGGLGKPHPRSCGFPRSG